MNLVFVWGLPGTGKLTVGQQLAEITGYRLFHDHLVVDTLLSVFDVGSPGFVVLREAFWLAVFEHSRRAGLPGLIFTFVPEPTIRPTFIDATVADVALSPGGRVTFVELTCATDEIERRLQEPSRRIFGKLTSVPMFRELAAVEAWTAITMPPADIRIDTGVHPARTAAELIAARLHG